MGKKEKPAFLDYLNAVKKADREREIELHGKQISTRPQRIVRSKKVYDRNRKKRDCSSYDDGLFFVFASANRTTFCPAQLSRLSHPSKPKRNIIFAPNFHVYD